MRVRCVKAECDEDITVGRTYNVINKHYFGYTIIDDNNDEHCYIKEFFEVIKENLNDMPTCDLVEELIKREGVISHKIGNEEMFRITTVDFNGNVKHRTGSTSPCILLEIID